jgi:hypothetical protein
MLGLLALIAVVVVPAALILVALALIGSTVALVAEHDPPAARAQAVPGAASVSPRRVPRA